MRRRASTNSTTCPYKEPLPRRSAARTRTPRNAERPSRVAQGYRPLGGHARDARRRCPMILAGPEPAAVAGAVGAAAVGALVVAALAHLLLLRLGRRSEVMIDLAQRVRQPTRVTLVLVAVLGALDGVRPTGGWVGPVEHLLLFALIAA